MFTHRFMRALAVSTAMTIAVPAVAVDLSSKFSRISVGLTREQVLLLMETPPTSVSESSTLGVGRARLRWQEGPRGAAYVVILWGGRVVGTQNCDPGSDC